MSQELDSWAQLFKKVDNAIQWITQLISLILILWIAIYLVDSTIQRLNYWSLFTYNL